jgi:hypothetical protein
VKIVRTDLESWPTRTRDGNTGSACRDRPALNVLHKAPDHVPPLIDIWERRRSRGAAVAAHIALPLNLDHHLLALRREIVKMLNIPAVFHESGTTAGRARCIAGQRLRQHHVALVILPFC